MDYFKRSRVFVVLVLNRDEKFKKLMAKQKTKITTWPMLLSA